jgi:hypothetical protein
LALPFVNAFRFFVDAFRSPDTSSIENYNTIKTSAAANGIGERTFFTWMETKPAFAAAVNRARAKAKAKLVRVITKQAPRDWRAAAFILERSWPNEYARTERVEQIGEQADDKNRAVCIYYNSGNSTLEELLNFPLHPSYTQGHDSPKVARAKQRLLDQMTGKAPAQPVSEEIEDSDFPPEEKVSDAPPPQVIHPALTGRIRPEWKGNGK